MVDIKTKLLQNKNCLQHLSFRNFLKDPRAVKLLVCGHGTKDTQMCGLLLIAVKHIFWKVVINKRVINKINKRRTQKISLFINLLGPILLSHGM